MSSQEVIFALFSLVVIVVALLFVKKITGCLLKTVIMAAVLAVLAVVYFGIVKV